MDNLTLIFWMLCGIVATIIGSKKGEGVLGFIVGFLLGPVGVLMAILSKGDRKSCSFCKESIHKKATVCRYCQKAIEQMLIIRCPSCRKEGQVKESALNGSIACYKCGHTWIQSVSATDRK
jgi:hypothetical protein